jgi:hypothetical protein
MTDHPDILQVILAKQEGKLFFHFEGSFSPYGEYRIDQLKDRREILPRCRSYQIRFQT